MRLVWVLCAAALAGCSQNDSLDGRVVLSGQSDHSGVLVFAAGRLFSEDSVVTGPDGRWHFRIGGRGARYFIKTYAPDTLEKTQEILVDVAENESKTAPDVVFTPTGHLDGVVTASGAPAEGARVSVEGTDREATTDAHGAYALDDLPVGSYTLRISVDGRPAVTTRDVVVAYAKTTQAPVDVP